MPHENLSCILAGAGQVSFENRPFPELQDPFEVRVRIKYTGVCGSDVHLWVHGGVIGPIKSPVIMGHEAVGIVDAIGAAVTTLRPGDRVSIEPGAPCRRCSNCLAGRYHLCPQMKFAASPPYPGTLTKFYVTPEDFCYKLPEHVSLEEGVLIEPLAVAVHMVRLAKVTLGTSVVVFGAGPVGLLCGAAAKAMGAETLVMVDIVESRVEFAQKYLGAGTFIPSTGATSEENAASLRKDHGLQQGADVVLDASGAQASIQTGVHACKVGGVFVQGGMGTPEIVFPITMVCMKELYVKGSFRYGPGDFELALKMVSSGKVTVKELVTGVVEFRQVPDAWENARAGKGIKTLIKGVED